MLASVTNKMVAMCNSRTIGVYFPILKLALKLLGYVSKAL